MNAKIFITVAVMLFTFGCSLGAHLAGNMAADIIDSAFKPKPQKKVLITKEVEKLRIGYYNVGFYEGAYWGEPSILLIAKYDAQKIEEGKLLVFKKESYSAMQLLRDFAKLSEPEKRQRIRSWYIKQHDFDLGPEPADGEPSASPEPAKPAPEPSNS